MSPADKANAKPSAPILKKPNPGQIDFATILGIVIALTGILGGLVLEGGKLRDIAQFTAGLIVLGGTIGAVMVSMPLSALKGAARRLIGVIKDTSRPPEAMLEEIIAY